MVRWQKIYRSVMTALSMLASGGGAKKARAARLLAPLYVFACLIAAMHHHGPNVSQKASSERTQCAVISAPVAGSATISAADGDCVVCDFISHLVSPAQYAAVRLEIAQAVYLPSVMDAATWGVPERICRRSRSRAPPVVLG